MKHQVEHRHYQRVDVPLEAWIYAYNMQPLRVVTKNISREGILLDTAQVIFPDACIVEIVLTDLTIAPITCARGEVVHSTPAGTGVMLRIPLPPSLFNCEFEARVAGKKQSPLTVSPSEWG